MIVDADEIKALRSSGAKVTGPGGRELKLPAREMSEAEYLLDIAKSLRALVHRPTEAPVINVQPTPVTVSAPPPSSPLPPPAPVRAWRFTIHRDVDGLAREIIAEAAD